QGSGFLAFGESYCRARAGRGADRAGCRKDRGCGTARRSATASRGDNGRCGERELYACPAGRRGIDVARLCKFRYVQELCSSSGGIRRGDKTGRKVAGGNRKPG